MSSKVRFYLLLIHPQVSRSMDMGMGMGMGMGMDSTVLASDFVYNIVSLDPAKNCFIPIYMAQQLIAKTAPQIFYFQFLMRLSSLQPNFGLGFDPLPRGSLEKSMPWGNRVKNSVQLG